MKYRSFLHCALALFVGASLLLTGCAARVAPEPTPQEALESTPEDDVDNSFEAVSQNIDLRRWDAFAVTSPEEDAEVGAETYYITGTSNPDKELLLNGQIVEQRGALGSFGVYAALEEGKNTFVFAQGDDTRTVMITRNSNLPPATTKQISAMTPANDLAARAGEVYTLSCVAPSGAAVTAAVGGRSVPLKQSAQTDLPGVPVTFSSEFVPDEVEGVVNLGAVSYTLRYEEETTEFASVGSLFVVGSEDELVVRGKDVASVVFTEEDDESPFYSTLPKDAVDVVEEIGTSMYRLGMGGWVFKTAVEPLADPTPYQNQTDGVQHETADGYETFLLTNTATPPYSASWGDGVYQIAFYHTSGAGEIPLADGSLFQKVEASESEGKTVLTFYPVDETAVWGFLVDYVETGARILIKEKPALSPGEKPLAGITVALDPGHGGKDSGALGVAKEIGPAEKEINLATALATRQYLRGLGATVVMTREGDDKRELNEVLAFFRDPSIDFSVSIHSNSIFSGDGSKVSGTETFYYEEGSRIFAEQVQSAVTASTDRKNREAKSAYYKVTLNSLAPTILLEMGFLTNPLEYDNLCSNEGIYAVAQSVGEGIVAALSAPTLSAESSANE